MSEPVVTYVLGMNAKIYIGDAGAELSAMTEMGNAKDVTLTLQAGEADITTRDNGGWKATAPTLRECSAEFEMVWRPGDTGFEAIKDAFLANTTVGMAILDGDKAVAGNQGPHGDWSITQFSRKESLTEAITVSVTAKLAAFIAWVVTTTPT